jgi:hypothetical protein
MNSRGFLYVAILVGGTVFTVILPAAVSAWVAFRAAQSREVRAIVLHGVLAACQVVAIWDAYAAIDATILSVYLSSRQLHAGLDQAFSGERRRWRELFARPCVCV